MNTAENNANFITEEGYLEGELHSDIKHEYIDGEVFAMSGARANHNQISGNIFGEFRNHLKGKSCRPFTSDMKVKVDSRYFYPDAMVVCTEVKGGDTFTTSPHILVEVLSKSTRKMDHSVKRDAYLQIPSLEEYVLIEQDFVHVEVARRSDGWKSTHYFLGDDVPFAAIGLTLSVEDIYERVDNEDMTAWFIEKAETEIL